MLHLLYAAATRWRRRHGQPRRLARPVVSIGNIAAGGRAKTPMAELVARMLMAAGERPAILSRGYARERSVDRPVVVRDAQAVRGSLAESGDEPLMLAERLEGAIVVVSPDRGRAGVVAEQLGATVHVLDDAFQHVRVARDVDIVMVEPDDLSGEVFPTGRLREPIDALNHANAIVVIDGAVDDRVATAEGLSGLPGCRVFAAARRVLPPPADLAGLRAFLVSGIADNAQFAWAVSEAGWQAERHAAFKDHHRYSAEDAARIARDAKAAGADYVLTTAKDAVRLREVWRPELALHIAELVIEIDDREAFSRWLIDAVARARAARADQELRARRAGPRRAS